MGELSSEAQVALLRVLETHCVTRVGGTTEHPVDVRIVAATHRSLEDMVDDGSFRQDLLYRINAVILTVPPLRDRPDEITPLADRFLAEARRRYNITAESIQAGAIALLLSYDWPGNVRELRNVIEHAAINAHGTVVTEGHLRDRLAGPQRSARAPDMRDDTRMRFKERVRNFEVQLIVAALRETGGNQSAAARRLRMPLRTLTHKLRHGDIPIDVSS